MTDAKRIAEGLTEAQRGWTPAIRDHCQNECAFYGDPPCWDLHNRTSDCPNPLEPCDECRAVVAELEGE